MKIYIAGPMRGYPDLNKPEFARVAAELRAQGHEVISPGEIEIEGWDPNWSFEVQRDHMRRAMARDLEAVCSVDALYMLEGWERSKGATAEWCTARAIGLGVIYQRHTDSTTRFMEADFERGRFVRRTN